MKAKGERRGWRSAEQRKKATGDRQKERMEENEEVIKEKKIKLEIRTGQKDNIKVNADENVTGEHRPSPKPSHLPPQRLLVLLPHLFFHVRWCESVLLSLLKSFFFFYTFLSVDKHFSMATSP